MKSFLRCSPYLKFRVPKEVTMEIKTWYGFRNAPLQMGKVKLHAEGGAQNGTFNGERLFVFHGGLFFLLESTKPLATTLYRPRLLSFSTRLTLKMFPCHSFSLFFCSLPAEPRCVFSEDAVALWMRGESGWIAAEMPRSDTSCSRPRQEVGWRCDVDPEMHWSPDDVLTCSQLPQADALWGRRLGKEQAKWDVLVSQTTPKIIRAGHKC